jgi:hypothetical protein
MEGSFFSPRSNNHCANVQPLRSLCTTRGAATHMLVCKQKSTHNSKGQTP